MKNIVLLTALLFLVAVIITGCGSDTSGPNGKSVSVSALKHTVWEGDTAVFKVSLSEPNKTGSDLKVFMRVEGTAVEGVDMDSVLNSGFILIPPDSQSAVIKTHVFADSAPEETEHVRLVITGISSSEYGFGLDPAVEQQIIIIKP